MNALSVLLLGAPVLVMMLAGFGIAVFIVTAYGSLRLGIAAIAAWYFIDAALLDAGGFRLGINLYYTDLLMVALAVAAGLRVLFARDFPWRQHSWMLFCTMFGLSLVIGLATFGTTAGVQSRGYFYFVVAGTYAMSFPVDDARMRFFFHLMIATACAFLLLTFYRWVVFYIPIRDLLPEGGAYNIDGEIRVIYANHTLVLAQVLVAGVFFSTVVPGLRWARILAPILFGVVVVLQHRSVWLALLVGVVASFMVNRSKRRGAGGQVLGLLAMMALVIASLVLGGGGGGGVASQIQTSAQRAVEGRDTTGARLQLWRTILVDVAKSDVRTILIGKPFGSDTRRIQESDTGEKRTVSFYAHNLYVQTLVNMGVIGVAALLLAFWFVCKRLYQACLLEASTQTQLILVWMLMQVVYYVPYGQDYLQSAIFGLALAYVIELKKREVKPLSLAMAHSPVSHSRGTH